jgi:RHS repeat-associated protein
MLFSLNPSRIMLFSLNNANQLTQVDRDGQTFSNYLYDGDGNRIKKTEMNEDVQDFITTIYIYSGLDVLYEVNTMGTALYIYGPSGRIAKQTTVNNETNTFYSIKDHLESTRLVTDSNGTPLTSVEYYPFGRQEYSGSQECNLFTGKEKDATGLSYFGARYYDPETGRFLTRDPYTFLPDDLRILSTSAEDLPKWLLTPQRFNRFSYAGNNPLRYTDPTGLSFTCIDPECQDLLGGEENSENPSSEEASDDSECDEVCQRQRRQEECKRKCKNDPYIQELLKEQHHYQTKLKWLRRGSFLLCLGAGILNVFLGIICATSALIGDLDTELSLDRIEQEIRDMGCACVL